MKTAIIPIVFAVSIVAILGKTRKLVFNDLDAITPHVRKLREHAMVMVIAFKSVSKTNIANITKTLNDTARKKDAVLPDIGLPKAYSAYSPDKAIAMDDSPSKYISFCVVAYIPRESALIENAKNKRTPWASL